MTFALRPDLTSWGRVVRRPSWVAAPRFRQDLDGLVAERQGTVLPVGLRRSYGDSVLNSSGAVIDMTGLDRRIAFDPVAGLLRAEAGATFGDIISHVVPHGFFLPVTPGTRFVTLGGAIANDVHGKNHHRAGAFGRHVVRLGLLRSDGMRLELGPEREGELFAATIGGLGLTGIIEWAEIRLQRIGSTSLDVESLPYASLSEFWRLADESRATHEHLVAWFDCTSIGRSAGRGIFSRANWSDDGVLVSHRASPIFSVPVDAPGALLNRTTLKLLNRLYYYAMRRNARGVRRLRYASFFHPLDRIDNWNRLYGRRGFWQYQCVVPRATMQDAVAALLAEIGRSDQGSFLAVLKMFGDIPSPGLLSFPMEGATLAVDFPNRGDRTSALFARLDAIVAEAKGRLYAAKDGRIPRAMWTDGYRDLELFMRQVDPAIASDFWRRVAA